MNFLVASSSTCHALYVLEDFNFSKDFKFNLAKPLAILKLINSKDRLSLYLRTFLSLEIIIIYARLMNIKRECFDRSVGVSNFGIQHLKGLEEAGLPTPSVNQIELHPFCKREKLVDYCREKNIAVMGYCPLARGQKFDDPDLKAMAKRYGPNGFVF